MAAQSEQWRLRFEVCRLEISARRLLEHTALGRINPFPLISPASATQPEGQVQTAQFHLFCADPPDGFAKFQLQIPVRPGGAVLPNDRREPLGYLVVAVDAKARPMRERGELDVQIDDNLILHAQARSLNRGDLAEAEVHNLEFGLSLPGAKCTKGDIRDIGHKAGSRGKDEKGGLVLRSNIADRPDVPE